MPTSAPGTSDLLEQAAREIRNGKLDQAMQSYEAALARDAALPDAWFNLAWLQRVARRFDDALRSYAEALAHGVAQPEQAHLNRAAILSEHLQRSSAAEDELRAALSVNSRFVPAWLNLGNLHEDQGRPDQAIAAYREALAIEPGNGRAHERLGMIDVHLGRSGQAVARLKDALTVARTSEDRAEMLFALGTALDAQGCYDDAFQAFEAANWLARSVARRRYDPRAHERLIDSIIAAVPHPVPPADPDGSAPIFICGMFRSGSTLAEQILGRHPLITSGGELDFIPAMIQSQLQPYPQTLAALTPADSARLRADYLLGLARTGLGDGLVTDKRCDNFLHIGLIKALFPEAKIVHTVRRPLDNLLSIYFLHFGEAVTYGHDLRDAAHFYVQYRRLMAHWRRLFAGDIHDLDYDQTVSEPRATVEPLLSLIGLQWDEACLGSRSGAVRTASAWQVRQPIHTRSSGRWRYYRDHLGQARQILAAGGLDDETDE